MSELRFTCPVCGWPALEENPEHRLYNICPSCGTEFGYDDPKYYELRRKEWLELGVWWCGDIERKPDNWDMQEQLKNLSKSG
jgi:hypothetical protein